VSPALVTISKFQRNAKITFFCKLQDAAAKTHYPFNEVYRDKAVHNQHVRFKNHEKSQEDDFSGCFAMSRNKKMQPKVTQ
jgi:hypothetical protein